MNEQSAGSRGFTEGNGRVRSVRAQHLCSESFWSDHTFTVTTQVSPGYSGLNAHSEGFDREQEEVKLATEQALRNRQNIRQLGFEGAV